MASSKSLTVEEAIELAEKAEMNLRAFERTAPRAVAALGGRDALAAMSRNSCIGPMPRLTEAEWCAMSDEYEERRNFGDLAELHRGLAPRGPARQ